MGQRDWVQRLRLIFFLSKSYDYPGNKEYTSKNITRLDLAKHFATYNA